MDLISSRYRKPKGKSSKRKKASLKNISNRWNNSSTVDVTQNESSVTNTLSCESQVDSIYIIVDKQVFSSLLRDVCCTECQTSNLDISTGSTFDYVNSVNMPPIQLTVVHAYPFPEDLTETISL